MVNIKEMEKKFPHVTFVGWNHKEKQDIQFKFQTLKDFIEEYKNNKDFRSIDVFTIDGRIFQVSSYDMGNKVWYTSIDAEFEFEFNNETFEITNEWEEIDSLRLDITYYYTL